MMPELSLQVAPLWENVGRIRRQTLHFLEAQALPAEVVDAISMVACELAENATKYGDFDARRATIDVRVALSRQQVTVEVTNPVSATADENLQRLDRTVQWIRGFQDPFEAYLNRLQELSVEDLFSPESRLGLVRIAYEGQSVLDFYVNDDNVLAVSAMRRL